MKQHRVVLHLRATPRRNVYAGPYPKTLCGRSSRHLVCRDEYLQEGYPHSLPIRWCKKCLAAEPKLGKG